MSFDEKGFVYRTAEETQVNWGMKLLKIAVILLVISFSLFVVESLVEVFQGIGRGTVEIYFNTVSLGPYAFLNTLSYSHTTLIMIAALTLAIGLFCLSKIIPHPVNDKMKIIAWVIFSIIILDFIVGIVTNIAYISQNNSIRYSKILSITFLIKSIIMYLLVSIGGILLMKQVTQLSEIQGNGTNGGKKIPIVTIVFYSLWMIGKIVYYAIVFTNPYYTFNDILDVVVTIAVYMENIGQLLYAVFAMTGYIITIVKLRKLSVEEIAMASRKLY